MTDTKAAGSGDDVARLVESAQRLGIELDEADTERWLAAMTKEEGVETSDIVIDANDGVFGHRVSMLDFSPRDLARFRRIGEVVEVTGPEGVAEGALALSGSAAQSKIQTHPGDADFFQRLNIKAATRDEACSILAGLMKDKAIAFESGPTYQFIEAKWSSYPFDCVQGRGAPEEGRPDLVEARRDQGRPPGRRGGRRHRPRWTGTRSRSSRAGASSTGWSPTPTRSG